jgi:hypothetical protein
LSQPIQPPITFADPTACYISLADPIKDEKNDFFMLERGRKDLAKFLLSRLSELASGGIIMFNSLGYSRNHLSPSVEEENTMKKHYLSEIEERCLEPYPFPSYYPLPTSHRIGKLFSLLLSEAKKKFVINESAGGNILFSFLS